MRRRIGASVEMVTRRQRLSTPSWHVFPPARAALYRMVRHLYPLLPHTMAKIQEELGKTHIPRSLSPQSFVQSSCYSQQPSYHDELLSRSPGNALRYGSSTRSVLSTLADLFTGLLPQPPTAYLIQPPHGQHESSFLPTMVEFPSSLPTTVPACEVVLSTLPPMPQPLPHWPAAGPSIALPPVPYHPALATYRFPANASDEQIDRELSYKSGDKLPPLGQKSLLLPPLPSILAPRRSSAGLFAQETMAKGAGRGGKKKAKHSCKLCCISFTRAHDLKRHNTIHKTGE